MALSLAISMAHAQSAPSHPNAPSIAAPVGTGIPTWIEQKTTDSQTQMTQIQASLNLSQDKIDKLKAEIAAMKDDRDKQNAALIAAISRVKTAEADVA